MDSAEPVVPDEKLWITYSRKWALPLSALTSPLLHVAVIVLVVVLSLITRHDDDSIEFDEILIAENPGGGNNGLDDGMRLGLPQGKDVGQAVSDRPKMPLPDIANQPLPVVHQAPPAQPEKPVEIDVKASIEQKYASLQPLPSLKPLFKGSPDGIPTAAGTAGRGSGKGPGTGPGEGPGDGSAGHLSQKQKRQLRWTLLFNIKSARNYLDQLGRMNAIIGVQYPDQSIKLIRDLSRRPARLEAGDRVPDRIFWMDDNADSVRSIASELGIADVPWRVIAFFPASIEEELVRKEHAYGLVYGRESEDQILETVFQVTDHYGDIGISVVRQEGKK